MDTVHKCAVQSKCCHLATTDINVFDWLLYDRPGFCTICNSKICLALIQTDKHKVVHNCEVKVRTIHDFLMFILKYVLFFFCLSPPSPIQENKNDNPR